MISANHSKDDFSCWGASQPICIGKRSWIGANTVILLSVTLGDECIVGAGNVLKDCFPN